MTTNKNIEDITKQLENGVKAVFESERYKEYLDCMSKFYDYSANNCMLIYMQMPTATLIAGYNTWKNKFDRQVRKGEKAIKILAPMPHKIERENDRGEIEEIRWMTFRAVSVFDVSQTEGKELPKGCCQKLTADFNGYNEIIDKLKKVSEVPVLFAEITTGANGYYSHVENNIRIKDGMSEAQTVKTLIHEIAHSILHKKDGEEEKASRNTKEVQAESVAYIVSNYLGLDTAEYSFGYVAGWSDGQDVKELTASMEVIKKTAKQIIDGLAEIN